MKEPTVWTRLRARAAGEIPADELAGYRAAGIEVWSLVESAAERRRSGEILPVENLGAWIVFTFQTFGNALLDADAEANPRTVGYVPPLLHGTVLNLYGEVGPWLHRATDARAGGARPLRRRIPVPFPQTPRPVLASLTGVRALEALLTALADELPHLSPDAPEGAAAALGLARYSEGLVRPGRLSPDDCARLAIPLRRAAVELFRAGQIAAYPPFGEVLPRR